MLVVADVDAAELFGVLVIIIVLTNHSTQSVLISWLALFSGLKGERTLSVVASYHVSF